MSVLIEGTTMINKPISVEYISECKQPHKHIPTYVYIHNRFYHIPPHLSEDVHQTGWFK